MAKHILNILQYLYSRFLKYVWLFLKTMYERVKTKNTRFINKTKRFFSKHKIQYTFFEIFLVALYVNFKYCHMYLFSKSSLKKNLFHPSLFETRKKHTSDRVFSILNIIQRYILQQKSSQT